MVRGLGPIHMASFGGKVESLRFLLEIGVDKMSQVEDSDNRSKSQGLNSFFIALQENQFNVLDLLLEQPVDLSVPTTKGKTFAHELAIRAQDIHSEKILNCLKALAFDPQDVDFLFNRLWHKLDPLDVAILLKRTEDVKELLAQGFQIHTLLRGQYNDYWMIELLLHGYNPEGERVLGKKGVEISKILKLLLKFGLNRNELYCKLEKKYRLLYNSLLSLPEQKLLKIFTEENLLNEILKEKVTLPKGYNLVRIEGNHGTTISAAEFPRYFRTV